MFKKKELTRLGDILVSKGLITPAQLDLAIAEQSRRKRLLDPASTTATVAPIGEILIELGFIDRLQLKRGLNWQLRLRHASIAMALCAPFMIFSPSAAASTLRAPITVEAENYSAMKGVVNEATTDIGGGQAVGYIDNGDWMNYDGLNLNLTKASLHKITLRIASLNGGGSVQIKDLSTGNVIDTISIPKTDGWKTWVDVEKTVTIPAETKNLQLFAVTGGFNLNWLKLENIEPEDPIPEAVVSRVIEAESYSSMSGVKLETTKDAGGGQNVSYIDTGDWLNYENADLLIPKTAVYKVTFRVAALNAGGVIELKDVMSGALLDTVTVPKTDGWQTWVDVVREVTLPQGLTKLQVFAKVGGFNFNLFKVESIAAQPPTTTVTTPPTTTPVATPETVFPYVIQSENYSTMAGVKTEKTSDEGGGLNVGYIDTGDWMSYSTSKIKAPFTGKYKVSYRVASLTGGAVLAFNDITTNTTVGTVSVPKTGGWQQWQTIDTEVELTEGDHTFTLVAKTGGANINWIQIEPIGTTMPLTIQAEDYTSMLGVKAEKTSDVSGVSNVGYIETGDWMAYDNVDVFIPATRTYKVTYRVAANAAGSIVQLHSTDKGTVFDTATLPNTSGWQKWADVERIVTLPAGKHHFGIKAAKGGFNINWFKVEAVDQATTGSSVSSSSSSSSAPSVNSSSSSIAAVSSSSKAAVSSSSSSSSSAATNSQHVAGPVGISWNAPNKRENGAYLDITEVGGYEIRYKKTTDSRFTYISINDAWTTSYNFPWLEGEYIFQIAAFDKNGIYSPFVDIQRQ